MYHIFKNPQITDSEYDQLKLDHRKLVREYPTEATYLNKARTIAEQLMSFGTTTRHDFPVLELNEITEINRLKGWLDMVDSNTPILITPSYVGITLELVYLGGQLHKAVNKGDGIFGLDVTAQAYLIDGIPQFIAETERVSIRGTVTVPYAGTGDLDVKMDITHALMARGTTNPDIKAIQEKLMFIPTEANIPGTTFNTKEIKTILLAWDFYGTIDRSFPANRKEVGYLEEIIDELYSSIHAHQGARSYNDGLVFTVVDTQRKLELGYTSRYPEWAIKLIKKRVDV